MCGLVGGCSGEMGKANPGFWNARDHPQSSIAGCRPGRLGGAAGERSALDEEGAPYAAVRLKTVLLRALDLTELGADEKC